MILILGIGILAYLLFELQRQVYHSLWNQNLHVRISFSSPYIFEGEKGELSEVIENRKWLPLTMLKVKFQTSRNLEFANTRESVVTDQYYRNDVFQVSGGEKITRTLRFTGKKRGYYHIMEIDLLSTDLFMTMEMLESRETDEYLYVYPRPFQSRELQFYLQRINGELTTRRNLLEDPFEYRGIREYQPYDDIRSVNWKATARVQGLMVNQKGYTTKQTVRIFFNIQDDGILKKEDAVESSLQIAAGIAQYFLKQGVPVALYGNGVDMLSGAAVEVKASAGNGQMDSIYKALARVDTGKAVMEFAETFGDKLMTEGKDSQTFFVSSNAYPEFLALIEQYHNAGRSYYWFYPVWESKDPSVPDWIRPHARILHIRG